MQNTWEWVRTNFLSDLLVLNVVFYSVSSYSRGSVATLKYRSAAVKQQCFVWKWIHFLLFLPAFWSSVMKISFPTSYIFQFTYCIAKILSLVSFFFFLIPQSSPPLLFNVKINGQILLFPLFCTFNFLFTLTISIIQIVIIAKWKQDVFNRLNCLITRVFSSLYCLLSKV